MRNGLVDNVTEMLIEAWQKHQLLRPFNPDPDLMGAPPDFAIQQMDRWAREDMSYRNIIGSRLATNALHVSTESGDDA